MPPKPPIKLLKPDRHIYERQRTALREAIKVRQERNKEIKTTIDQWWKTDDEFKIVLVGLLAPYIGLLYVSERRLLLAA